MTEIEALRIINEARSENPIFIRFGRQYVVRDDGRVEVWLPVGKSGQRWKSYQTVSREDFIMLPRDVRQAALAKAVTNG